MTKHQKRLSVPNSWPVERKTETFTVKADAGPHGEEGVPLVIVLRDVLGYVDSRKEARFALNEGSIRINGKPIADESRPIGMFDILAFTEREEYYRVFPDEGGRLSLTPIDEDAAGSKLGKITGKRQLSGGRTQLTMHDGQTLLVDDDAYSPGDSLVIGNEDEEIVAHFPYDEGELVTAVRGSHAGQIGRIDEITVTGGSADNVVYVDALDGGTFETIEEYVVVIDENFVEDDSLLEDGAADTEPDGESAGETDEVDEGDADEPEDADAADEGDADEPEDADAADDTESVEDADADESEDADETEAADVEDGGDDDE